MPCKGTALPTELQPHVSISLELSPLWQVSPSLILRLEIVDLRGVEPRGTSLQGMALTRQTSPCTTSWSHGDLNPGFCDANAASSRWTMTPLDELSRQSHHYFVGVTLWR